MKKHHLLPDKIKQSVRMQFVAPTPSVGEIVRVFKAASTRLIRQHAMHNFAWQRNYYEHIIRDENSLTRIREYIRNNPMQWALDPDNPEKATGQEEAQ